MPVPTEPQNNNNEDTREIYYEGQVRNCYPLNKETKSWRIVKYIKRTIQKLTLLV